MDKLTRDLPLVFERSAVIFIAMQNYSAARRGAGQIDCNRAIPA